MISNYESWYDGDDDEVLGHGRAASLHLLLASQSCFVITSWNDIEMDEEKNEEKAVTADGIAINCAAILMSRIKFSTTLFHTTKNLMNLWNVYGPNLA